MPIHSHLPVPALNDYRNLLLELIISYLLKQPADYLDFALDFFIGKRKERQGAAEPVVVEEEEEAERRETIYADSVDYADFKELPGTAKSAEVKRKILESVESFFLFKYLQEEQVCRVVESMRRASVEKGEILMRQDEDGDLLYVIEKGYFQSYREKEGVRSVLNTYRDVGYFGELALLYSKPRDCTVQALTPGRVYLLDRGTFRKVVEGSMREKRELLMRTIVKVPYMRSLSDDDCLAVVDNLEDRHYQAGEVIYQEGEVVEGMYFLLRGEVEATYTDEFDKKMVNTYSDGDHFGETAFFSHTETKASCRALTQVQLAFLSLEKFERLFGSCLEILKKMKTELGESISDVEFGHYKEDLNLRISYFS